MRSTQDAQLPVDDAPCLSPCALHSPSMPTCGCLRFFVQAAVQEAIGKGLLEHPEMPLSETLAMAKVFDDIRKQIGLKYPWDEDAGEPSSKRARK